MTERKYALKYDLSDGQTNLTAGNFSVWDGDNGIIIDELSAQYSWDSMWTSDISENGSNCPSASYPTFDTMPIKVGDYYQADMTFYNQYSARLLRFYINTYIGKDGDDASGKNGTYITAVRVEAV